MARFRLHISMIIGAVRLKPGTVVVDSLANKQPGDIVWTALNAGAVHPGMVALDATATSMQAASRYAATTAPTWIDGANSIDA